LVVATALVATFAACLATVTRPVTLRIDGEGMESDVPPVTTVKGEVFVPLRVVGENLGADANFDPKTGLIELVRGNDTLRLHVGDKVATLNGNRLTMKHAPFTVRGRTMIGLSVVARAFNSKVRYDGAHAKIDVTSPGMVEAGAQQDEP
jgi:N-acetylmuramoyl-L-alanine amidase